MAKDAASDINKAKYEATQKRLAQIQRHFSEKSKGGRLQDKVCIITGVASPKGIGRASALLFAREGAKALYLVDFRGDDLPEVEAEFNKRYPQTKTVCLQGDAADETLIKSLCDRAVEEHGYLSCFFANAGIVTASMLNMMESSDVEETLRVNTISVFLACKYASDAMKRSRVPEGHSSTGSIILTASVAGLRSGAGPVDYSASKAAVISMANTTAWQLGGTGIRCNAICPGLIETGMTEMQFEYAKSRGTAGKIGQLNPSQRYGIAEEIAYTVLFLASDESSYVNGVAIPVDGGLSASLPVAPGRFF